MDFPQPATLFCSRCINPYFKINIAFFCCPLFFKKYFNLWVRLKNDKNGCINSHLNPFMNLKDTLGAETFNPLGLCPFPEIFPNFLLKLYMSP